MPAKRLLLVAAAVAGGALAIGAILQARGDDGGDASPNVRAELSPCAGTRSNDCYLEAMTRLVQPAEDPRPVVQRIADFAWADPEFLLSSCHGLMHTVGREYAVEHDVTLDRLVDYLPRTNDPGCPAGFAHGLISGVAPQIDASRPEAQAAVCRREKTRYRRYSCVHGFGHAFMRIANERVEPALELCRGLGADASDCAQGVYHDYWFSVIGFDGTRPAVDPVRDPRELCAAQPEEFVRPCWYRAFVDTRPSGFSVASADDIDGLCGGLAGVQRSGCVTAGSVIGPVDPSEQLELCAGFRGADAISCLRGVKVQNLLRQPRRTYVSVIERCDVFDDGATRLECYHWLGKTFGVLTNGAFRTFGCGSLDAAARAACVEGVRAMDEPLVTFS